MEHRFSFFKFLLFALCAGCIEADNSDVDPINEFSEIYKPVYVASEEAYLVKLEPARELKSPGKIIVYGDFLMISTKEGGFHIYDNSNPSLPKPLHFVKIPGNNDIAVRNGVIFADNYDDVVAFRITESVEIEIIQRMENLMFNQEYPPFRDVYFECVDETKGVVVSWVKSTDRNVKCYRP